MGWEELPSTGRYVLLDLIGVGGMGRVFRAHDPRLERDVAIKLIGQLQSGTEARMRREARALGALAHPNVVAVYDVDAGRNGLFIAMELVHGVDLRDWLPTLPHWRDIARVFADAGRGLSAAHGSGLVHRDFKPANVMLGDDGRVRVMDFGLAREGAIHGPTGSGDPTHSEPLGPGITVDGSLVGTPLYMAPEIEAGAVATPSSDQYAFCLALFRALARRPAFSGATPEAVSVQKWRGAIVAPSRSNVPKELFQLCIRGLRPDPTERWPSMDAIVEVLDRVRARKPRRWRLAAAAAAGLSAGLAGLLGSTPAEAQTLEAVRTTISAARCATEAEVVLVRATAPQARGEFDIERLGHAYDLAVACERHEIAMYAASSITFAAGQRRDEETAARWFGHARSLIPRAADPELAEARLLMNYAPAQTLAGQPGRAVELLDRALVLLQGRNDAPGDLRPHLLSNRGVAYDALGRGRDGLADHQKALEFFEAELGPKHPKSALARLNVAGSLLDLGQFEDAIDVGAPAVEVLRAAEHLVSFPRVLAAYADLLSRVGRHDEAEAALSESLALSERIGHPVEKATALEILSEARLRASDVEGAVAAMDRAIGLRTKHGRRDAEYGVALSRMGRLLTELGRYADAEATLDDAEEVTVEVGGRENPALGEVAWHRANLRRATDDLAGALTEFQRATSLLRRPGAGRAAMLADVLVDFGEALAAADQPTRARNAAAAALPMLAMQDASPKDLARAQALVDLDP